VPGVVGRWLSSWRGIPIDLHSPLPIDVARTRLQVGGSVWSPALALTDGFSGRRVKGRVRGGHRVRLEAGFVGIRNSWRPVAHADLVAEGTGCRLTGTLRTPLAVLLFSGIWLGIAALVAVIGFLAAVVTVATGHAREVGAPAAVAGGGLGFVAVGASLMGAGFAMGRRDAEFLLGWLEAELAPRVGGL
jgi:hypothetical protein